MKRTLDNYFNIYEDKVIYPAHFFRRFTARIIDFFIAMFIPLLISYIYFEIQLHDLKYPASWSPVFITSNILSIFLIIFVMIVIPIINKKNPGQTIGKKILGITLLFTSEKHYIKSILIREIPLTLLFLIPIVIKLIAGYDESQVISVFSKHKDSGTMSFFPFLFDKWIKGDMSKGLNPLPIWQAVFIIISWATSVFEFIVLIAILFSILSSTKNIGLQDKMGKTAVVDLSSIIPLEETLEKYG